ncbi:MAG: lytic transglycosylase domain-containing protein [Bacteroidales bacterium]|nr:lytic transglycosylase domain-containing protein [Bacteroidales bacterium]
MFTYFSTNSQQITSKNENSKDIKYIIPKDIYFAGERIPIEYFDVYESLDRELIVNANFHSQTILGLKRAQRYFPTIVRYLKKYNIPEDFKYLAVVESNLSPALSEKGAAGIWQIMEGTARKYGLVINEEIDERYHFEKSTDAACRYLRDLYKIFKKWTLVAAAYNVGENVISENIAKQQVNDYFNMSLNIETARFVYRLVAVKLIYENPENFGFYISKNEKYFPIPFKTVVVDTTIKDLAKFAIKNNSNLKLLRMFNPWLRKNTLSATKEKPYEIKLIDTTYRYLDNLMKLFYYSDTVSVNDTLKFD